MALKVPPLSDSALKSAKPKEKPYKLADGQGLYLKVMTNGSKLWRMNIATEAKENASPSAHTLPSHFKRSPVAR